MFSNSKAFLFDLNGTMVNDMPYHIAAWHAIVNQLGATLTLEQVKHQCYGKNDELLERVFPGRFTLDEKLALGANKEAVYRVEFKPHLKLIDGLGVFLAKAYQQKIKMAIGSAAITSNIDFVLDNTDTRKYFDAIVSADHVHQSKPHPETFLKCAELLKVAPSECIVFEDTPTGVECAQNANMKTVVLLSGHKKEEFSHFNNIIDFINDYDALGESSF